MTTQSGASKQQDLDDLLEQVVARTTLFPLPPENFDPLTASKEELKHFGLPLEPDPDRQPALHAFWRRMYKPPLEFAPVKFAFKNIARLTTVNHRQRALGLRTRRQTSPNWSGAYIKPRDGQVFTAIWGQWQVPTPSVPPAEVGEGRYYRCSTWIGLDGQRRYYQSSLPQLGTEQSINDATGTREFSAWWQWWVRDQYFPPVDMGLTIHAGDLIMCNLRVVPPGRNKVRFQLRNESTMSRPSNTLMRQQYQSRCGYPARPQNGSPSGRRFSPPPYSTIFPTTTRSSLATAWRSLSHLREGQVLSEGLKGVGLSTCGRPEWSHRERRRFLMRG